MALGSVGIGRSNHGIAFSAEISCGPIFRSQVNVEALNDDDQAARDVSRLKDSMAGRRRNVQEQNLETHTRIFQCAHDFGLTRGKLSCDLPGDLRPS